jgi:cytidylate kinase
MAIITISRQIGSLGDEVAKTVADRLGYKLIEKSQISKILSEHGFSSSDIDQYDEKKPSLLQHLSMQKRVFERLIRASVYELAAKDDVVIVGRGAQVILKNIPGTLSVRIIAPDSTRVQRLMEQRECDEKNALWVIQRSDQNSSGYIHTYFNTDWDDSSLYDLILNTRTIPSSTCVEMIISAVGSDRFTITSPVSEKLIDLALTQKVHAVLLEFDEVEESKLVVRNRRICFSGSLNPDVEDACKKALSNVKGIIEIS